MLRILTTHIYCIYRSFHLIRHNYIVIHSLWVYLRPPLKKVCFLCSGWPKLWPVGRPQNYFFSVFFFFWGGGGGGVRKWWNLDKKKKWKKKSSHSAVIKSPGHWTGNNIFFKGGLTGLWFLLKWWVIYMWSRYLLFVKLPSQEHKINVQLHVEAISFV